MEHLASRGITCPQPVKNREDEVLGRLAGRPAAIVTFLDGLWICRPSAAHCVSAQATTAASSGRCICTCTRFSKPRDEGSGSDPIPWDA